MLEIVKMELIQREIISFKKDIDEVLQFTKDLDIQSRSDVGKAVDYIAKAKDLIDAIDSRKKAITKDARDYVTKVNGISKEFLEPLLLVEGEILGKIDRWKDSNREDFQFREEQAEDILAFDLEVLPIFDENMTIQSSYAKSYDKSYWEITVQDEQKVPREYLSVDLSKVEQAIKNGIRNIEGLKITKKSKTIVRRNKK